MEPRQLACVEDTIRVGRRNRAGKHSPSQRFFVRSEPEAAKVRVDPAESRIGSK
jgi:hypothetical protein